MAIVPDSDPHWARQNLTLCLCVCMCVYFGISVDMEMGRKNTRFGVATNHREIEGVIGHLCLLGFIILIKTCIKIEFWTRDEFGDLVMHREGVMHFTTSIRRRLPPSMSSCVCSIKQKCWIIIRHKCPNIVGCTSIRDARIRCSRFCYLLFPFWLSVYL